MDNQIAATDLAVEHRPPAGAQANLWCVLKGERVLFVNDQLDPALLVARAIATDDHCTAWLVVAGCNPIRIAIKGKPIPPTGALVAQPN
jgi:hypothetical protein